MIVGKMIWDVRPLPIWNMAILISQKANNSIRISRQDEFSPAELKNCGNASAVVDANAFFRGF
ncbi:hypothetical protein Mal48_10500 [Thalassoglobus polymorphus]|uniref:Uncharacterized protein n=1 Tax=Thalassoglobus polymorphus TaxID=2527994 RepID=A0A517QJN8_9PLAN|nr:hypothetical protein Mal48_10500 [Thalassoglobus polymorphus]